MGFFFFPHTCLLTTPESIIFTLFNMESVNTQPPAYHNDKIGEEQKYQQDIEDDIAAMKHGEVSDAFGNEEYAEIKYKTLKWWYVLAYTLVFWESANGFLGNVVCS